MNTYLADVNLGTQLRGLGILGLENRTSAEAPTIFNTLISSTVGLLTTVAAIWFLFILITGAIAIISSGGDKGAYEQARKKIQTGLIGIVVVVAAVFVTEFVGWLIGFDLILNPAELVNKIKII
jgi:hypothetical protein